MTVERCSRSDCSLERLGYEMRPPADVFASLAHVMVLSNVKHMKSPLGRIVTEHGFLALTLAKAPSKQSTKQAHIRGICARISLAAPGPAPDLTKCAEPVLTDSVGGKGNEVSTRKEAVQKGTISRKRTEEKRERSHEDESGPKESARQCGSS